MLIQEIVTVKNMKLKHIYSSNNKYIKQIETNNLYNEVYDTLKANFSYTETDQDIVLEDEIDVPQN